MNINSATPYEENGNKCYSWIQLFIPTFRKRKISFDRKVYGTKKPFKFEIVRK